MRGQCAMDMETMHRWRGLWSGYEDSCADWTADSCGMTERKQVREGLAVMIPTSQNRDVRHPALEVESRSDPGSRVESREAARGFDA
jgi:hypothetical protein